MKPKYLVLFSLALLLMGISALWAGWHGSASVTAGYPVNETTTSVQFCGSATGKLALTGILGVALGMIALLAALIAELASDPAARSSRQSLSS